MRPELPGPGLDASPIWPDAREEVLAEPDAVERRDGKPEQGDGREDVALDAQEGETAVADEAPIRQCEVTLYYEPRPDEFVASVHVPGEWNDWSPDGTPMQWNEETGRWEAHLGPDQLGPGDWGYKFLLNGETWILDPNTPLRKYDGKFENSRLVFPDCSLPAIELVEAKANWPTRSVDVVAQVYRGIGGEPVDEESANILHNGQPLEGDLYDPSSHRFVVHLEGLAKGKHSFVLGIASSKGKAVPLYAPLWLEEKEFSWRDAVLYFAMTDRFADGDPSNDSPSPCLEPDSKANWYGGDFAGIRQKIEEGYFTDLGVNALWISPANDNPSGCYKGSLGKFYTAYHGYFPVELEKVEEHFGTLQDLEDMVRAAHRKGIRVLMDLVANHVHKESAIYEQHPGWFHQEGILCGQDDNWNEHPEDCWFQPYMPDVDFRNVEALNAFTDAAIWWAQKADLDGFRVDAVKHLNKEFLRTLRYKVRKHLETTGVHFYLVGETFDSAEKIKQYVGPNELDGQFDYPLYWTILCSLARDECGMSELGQALTFSLTYYGSDAVMSRFLGNHDVARFITHATGVLTSDNPNDPNVGWLGWTNPPSLPEDQRPFKRLAMAFAVLATVRGVPLVYYGDEIGMPGAADPDNRRPMQFEGLSPLQKDLIAWVGDFFQFRALHVATRLGELEVLESGEDFMAYAVKVEGDVVIVAFARNNPHHFELHVGSLGLEDGAVLQDALDGKNFAVSGDTLDFQVEADWVRVLGKQLH